MKLHSSSLLLLVLLLVTTSSTVRPQQSSFTVTSIKPYDKAVPGQVMEVLIEGLGSGEGPRSECFILHPSAFILAFFS
jgi:hypothetical protein